jgi:hypothetical protein
MDFSLFRRAVIGTDVVAASNSAQGVGAGGDCVERVKNCREVALRILDALEGDKGVLERAAVQVAWERVLYQLAHAEPDADLKEIVANIQKLLGLRRAPRKSARAKAAATRAGASGFQSGTLERIEEALRVL